MASGWSLQPDGTMVRGVHCTKSGYLNVLREGTDLKHPDPCWACVKDLPPMARGRVMAKCLIVSGGASLLVGLMMDFVSAHSEIV